MFQDEIVNLPSLQSKKGKDRGQTGGIRTPVCLDVSLQFTR